MKKLIQNIVLSFENNKGGFSGRKLSAWFAVMVSAIVTYYLPEKDRLNGLYAWLVFALLCMGIVTVGNLIELKNGKDEKHSNNN